jgi:hypothetical protein
MAQDLDITDLSVVNRIVTEIEQSQNEDRKKEEWKAHNCFSGNQIGFVKDKIKKLFPHSHESMRISDISISKKVVSKIAKSYNDPPKRMLSNEDQTTTLEDIYKEDKFNRSYRELDKIFNLHRYAALWLNWREQEQSFQLMALAPYEFDTIRDQDTGEPLVFILNYPDSTITQEGSAVKVDHVNQMIAESKADSAANTRVYAMWTKDSHVVVKREKEEVKIRGIKNFKISVTYVPIEGNEQQVNPLGILPFVYVSKDMSVDYPFVNPLTEQSIQFNVLWSDLLSAASLQGFGQLVLKFPDSQGSGIEKLHTGLTTAIELPQSTEVGAPATDATYINPNPDLAGQKEVYLAYLQGILSEQGIESSQGLSGDVVKFSSGLDRMLSEANVQSLISLNQETYVDVENQIFAIMNAWFDTVIGGNPFNAEEDLMVIYPKPKILITDRETLENIQKRLDMGLIERFEALTILDPNMTEEAARNKLERIEEEKMARMQAFAPQLMQDTSKDDEEEDADKQEGSDEETEDS